MLESLATSSMQYILPQHLISRSAYWLAETEIPCVKNRLIKYFIKHYQVDLSQAAIKEPERFRNFNCFFKRQLQADARPLPKDMQAVVSPADGVISQIGTIENNQIIQAKGHSFSVQALLGGNTELAESFINGSFATIYLSPKDYHRVHMPVAGTLQQMLHIPGKLFSVNQRTAAAVPNLFARNERVVTLFQTQYGIMAVVLVGAMVVASIETAWHGLVTPKRRQITTTEYAGQKTPITIERGEEMGAFSLGSTVIALFPENTVRWCETLAHGNSVRMGQVIANGL